MRAVHALLQISEFFERYAVIRGAGVWIRRHLDAEVAPLWSSAGFTQELAVGFVYPVRRDIGIHRPPRTGRPPQRMDARSRRSSCSGNDHSPVDGGREGRLTADHYPNGDEAILNRPTL